MPGYTPFTNAGWADKFQQENFADDPKSLLRRPRPIDYTGRRKETVTSHNGEVSFLKDTHPPELMAAVPKFDQKYRVEEDLKNLLRGWYAPKNTPHVDALIEHIRNKYGY